jgi:hypothetical protein
LFTETKSLTTGKLQQIGRYATGTMNYQQQWAEIESQTNLHTLATELAQLRIRLQQTASSRSDFQQLGLLAEAEEQAEKQEGSKVLETLSKAGKGYWTSLRRSAPTSLQR